MRITNQPRNEIERRLNKLIELQDTRSRLRSDKRYIRYYRKQLANE